jgi:hypothetical protein
MAITNTAGDGVRVTTAAANSTLGSQASAAANEIIFPDTIAGTNNGNLEASPTYVGRKVIVRQGQSDEETRYITAIDGGGTTATVNEDWVTQPATNDTYHVSYRLADAETTGASVNLNSKTGLYEFGRNFTVGNSGGGGFAYFAITDYQAMEMDDSGNSDDFTVESDGRLDIGYLQAGSAIAGAIVTNVKDTDGEPYINFIDGAEVRAYAGIFWSQRFNTFISNPTSVTGNIDFRNCTFLKTAYTAQFAAADMTNITWQGNGDLTNDTFRITSGTNIDTIIFANTAGFSSLDDGVTETLEVRNCTFVGNSPNVTIFADKNWSFVNPLLWEATGSQIVFNADDLNTGSLKYSLDVNTAQPDGTLLSGSRVYIYEGLVNQDLPTDNRQGTDANGDSSSDVLVQRYTYPGSVFTTQSFGDFALKVYNYNYNPFVTSVTFDEAKVLGVTLTTDTNITETTQADAITSGSGIVLERHGPGETDTRPMKVIHYDGGVGAVPQVGEFIGGLTSTASGTLVEYIGTATEGTLVIELWDGTEFTNNEDLTGSITTFSASADLSGGGQSFYQEYTWEVSCSSKDLTVVYDYAYAKIAEASPDADWLNVIEWGEDEQSNLIYFDGTGYNTERNANLTEGVWLSNVGLGTISYMTSDAGVQYIPPVQYSFTLTGLIAGTEVRIFNSDTNEEIDGVESSSTTFSYTYVYTSDIPIFVVVFNLNYKDIRLTGLTLSNGNQSIPIQQQFDRNYLNP